jgi:hypothetical protein
VLWSGCYLSPIDTSIFRERALELTLHLALFPSILLLLFQACPSLPLFADPFPSSLLPSPPSSLPYLPGLSFVFEGAALLFTTGRHKYQSSPTTTHTPAFYDQRDGTSEHCIVVNSIATFLEIFTGLFFQGQVKEGQV